MSALLGLAILIGPSALKAEMGHKHETGKATQGAACQKRCSAMQLQGEVEALEKELKQVQATGGKQIEIENKKAKLRKHIAQHQADLNDLQARLEGKSTKSPGAKEMAMYQCPMKCTAPSDKPGRCPKCGMNMEALQQ